MSKINAFDLRHRSGRKLSEESFISYLVHLQKEVDELHKAIIHYVAWLFLDMEKAAAEKDHVIEEIADIYVCLLQIMFRLEIGFNEMDEEARRKIFLRFEDTDIIKEDTC